VTRFETSVRIRRPIGDVFDFVADPLNFRHWNSAVRTVWSTHGRERVVGSTYRMERDLPSGRVRNDIKIFAHEYTAVFGIRTTSGPTPFSNRYGFSSDHGETVVQLDGAFELNGVATLSGPLAGRAVKRGVEDNLDELKNIIETTPRLPRTVAADSPAGRWPMKN
jgi:Polyketide cyclase / dehydrase and lipid transport